MTTHEILLAAQSARQPLALADTDTKNRALEAMATEHDNNEATNTEIASSRS